MNTNLSPIVVATGDSGLDNFLDGLEGFKELNIPLFEVFYSGDKSHVIQERLGNTAKINPVNEGSAISEIVDKISSDNLILFNLDGSSKENINDQLGLAIDHKLISKKRSYSDQANICLLSSVGNAYSFYNKQGLIRGWRGITISSQIEQQVDQWRVEHQISGKEAGPTLRNFMLESYSPLAFSPIINLLTLSVWSHDISYLSLRERGDRQVARADARLIGGETLIKHDLKQLKDLRYYFSKVADDIFRYLLYIVSVSPESICSETFKQELTSLSDPERMIKQGLLTLSLSETDVAGFRNSSELSHNLSLLRKYDFHYGFGKSAERCDSLSVPPFFRKESYDKIIDLSKRSLHQFQPYLDSLQKLSSNNGKVIVVLKGPFRKEDYDLATLSRLGFDYIQKEISSEMPVLSSTELKRQYGWD